MLSPLEEMFHHQEKLGGGFKHFLNFHPDPWGNDQFDEHIFQMGGSTTNQKVIRPGKKFGNIWIYSGAPGAQWR